MGTWQVTTVAHRPPQIEENVGHLLSIPGTGLRLGTPRVNTFSGDATLGKTKVSLEQWYHEVQGVKDHYPESVVWESLIGSLKGTAADMAQYIGPPASVAHILQKLLVIFGMVASFDILMQNFYIIKLCKATMRSSLLCHKAGRDPQPNHTIMSWENDGSWGPIAPQGLPLP